MSLLELQYGSGSSSSVEFHPYGSEGSGHWTSFGLVDVFNTSATRLPSNWNRIVLSELMELLQLRQGWDGYNSGPISPAIAVFTLATLSSVMKPHTPAPAVVPAGGGGVQLEWHQGGLDVELMIYRPADAELSVIFHDGRPPIEEVALTTNFELLSEVLEGLV